MSAVLLAQACGVPAEEEPRRGLGGDDECAEPVDELAVKGQLNVATMIGPCHDTICSPSFPLAAGTPHPFTLLVRVDDGARAEQFTLGSDAADLLGLTIVSAVKETVNASDGLDADCPPIVRMTFAGDLMPLEAGTAHIVLKRDGEIVDTFTVVVDEIANMRVSAQSTRQEVDNVVESGLDVTAEDTYLELRLHALSATGRETYLGTEVSWEASPGTGVTLLGHVDHTSDDGLSADGQVVLVKAVQLGTSQVSVTAPDFSASVELRIAGTPPAAW